MRAIDYKTSSDPEKWAASKADLGTTKTGAGIQMVGYAVALANELGLSDEEEIELEHLYLHTKPTKKLEAAGKCAKQVVGTLKVGVAREEWKVVEKLARELRQVAKAASLDDVEPCDGYFPGPSCEAYGGCPFFATCLVHEASKEPASKTVEACKKPAVNTEVKHVSLKELLAKRAMSDVMQQQSNDLKNQVNAAANPPALAADAAANLDETQLQFIADVAAGKPEAGPVLLDYVKRNGALPQGIKVEMLAPYSDVVELLATAENPPLEAPQILPPDAPKSDPAKAAEPLPAVEAGPPIEPEKPKRGRKKAETEVKHIGNTVEPEKVLIDDVNGFSLYIDCVPSIPGMAIRTVNLSSYIAERVAEISRAFSDLVDIRLAPKKTAEGKDHPLAFGGWRGLLAAQCRLNPPKHTVLAHGVYGSEFAQVAIEALEPMAQVVVRGIR